VALAPLDHARMVIGVGLRESCTGYKNQRRENEAGGGFLGGNIAPRGDGLSCLAGFGSPHARGVEGEQAWGFPVLRGPFVGGEDRFVEGAVGVCQPAQWSVEARNL
jgi:hypothetical protein